MSKFTWEYKNNKYSYILCRKIFTRVRKRLISYVRCICDFFEVGICGDALFLFLCGSVFPHGFHVDRCQPSRCRLLSTCYQFVNIKLQQFCLHKVKTDLLISLTCCKLFMTGLLLPIFNRTAESCFHQPAAIQLRQTGIITSVSA